VRIDTNIFDSTNAELSKEPRYIVGIDFDGSITYITSHDGIPNVPGTPIENALTNISATTQTLNPDKANATVGTMSFSLIDEASAFTDLVRTKLDSNIGLKGRTVTFHLGFEGIDFTEFVLFQTQVIRSAQTKGGFYQILCADIQRETKTRIFELALTFLTTSISDTATTIPVLDLSGFEGNNHGTSYSDAPSANVIYIQIDQTKEIIRCPVSGISGNDFTGVTRGALSTKAKAVDVDVTLPSSRRPQVKEYVYLELPAVKLAYAILTGDIEGTADVLPSGWHAAVATSFVRLTDFTDIGTDLWDPADDTAGLVVRFEGLDAQDAKRFLETEIYLLLGCFSPVYADGQLGLKRMVPSLVDSPYVVELNDQNVTGHSTLTHDMESVLNNIRIDWNWNGTRFIRSTIFTDSTSITRHGIAPQKRIGFRGLAGTRFTEGLLGQMITSLRDMYTGPPLGLDVRGFMSLNQLEIGDPVRVNLTGIRDFSNTPANLQRTMVIHGMTVNMMQGVRLKLFGSSERLTETSPTADTSVLPAAFYPDIGTALSSIPGLMTGDVTNAGTFTLTGSSDMNAAASIFYHDGPLTISSTTTIIIENNVQLRVNGFLTINGTIDGIQNGHPGGTDTAVLEANWNGSPANAGVQGFIGNSFSNSGITLQPDHSKSVFRNAPYFTPSLYDAFPNIVTQVDATGNGSISGIPTDMRGGGGAAGARVVQRVGDIFRIKALGGSPGGTGGAGFCIISKGGDFGASGAINLSGGDGTENDTAYVFDGLNFFAGTAGAGVPGALLWLLDGSAVTFPDLLGKYTAITGEVQVDFPTAMPFFLDDPNRPGPNIEATPQADRRISLFDQSGTNFRIQFLAADDSAIDDQGVIVPAPTALAAVSVLEGVQLTWVNPPEGQFATIEIWASDDNDIANAVQIADTTGEQFIDYMDYRAKRTRFYWIRSRDVDGNVSLYEPDSTTTTATTEPLRERKNWLLDPEFDIGDPDPNWLGNGNGSQTEFWRANITGAGTADHVPGGGQAGSVAIDLLQDGTTARTELQHKKRVSFKGNNGTFLFQIKYRTEGSIDALDHDNFAVTIEVSELEFGGTITGFVQSPLVTLLRSATFVTYETVWSFATSSNINWVSFAIGLRDNQGTADKLRIDSIQVQSIGTEFGTVSASSQTKPGLVPLALSGDQGKFLQGDGTWGTPTGSGVDSFEGRTGVVTAIQADYDSFFLTPAEGDAAYSLLGHAHTLADITDSGALAALSTVGTVEIDNDAVTFAKMANIATARIIGRVTAATGDPEALTGTQATTLLDVFTDALKGLAPSSGGGTANFLRADGAWVAPPTGDRLVVGGNDALVAIAQGSLEARGSILGSSPPVDTDNGTNTLGFTNSDDTVIWGSLDFGSGAFGGLTNSVRGQNVRWRATKVAGGLASVFFADPDAGALLAYNGGQRIITLDKGIRVSRAATGASIYIEEGTAAAADVTGDGQFWVRTDGTPMFTGDDGVDIDLSATGGTGGVLKLKTADESVTNSTVFQDDNDFNSWDLAADQWYSIQGYMEVTSGITEDFKAKWVFANAPQDGTWSIVGSSSGSAFQGDTAISPTAEILILHANVNPIGYSVQGAFKTNLTTGGTLKLQWAQRISGGTATTVSAGSHITITPIP